MAKPAQKKEETGVFSIEANPFEDGEIPGVTQLLNRNSLAGNLNQQKKSGFNLEPTSTGVLLEKSAQHEQPEGVKIVIPDAPEVTRSSIAIPGAPAAPSQASGTRTNLVVPSTLKLKDFGVLFELKFHPEGSVFRYATMLGHKEAKLLPWQEKLFDRMKMDKQSVPAQEPFEEFTCRKHAFLFDAFGVHPDHFLQIVSPEYTNTRIVLVSDKSLVEHAAAIVEHYSKG